MSVADEMVPIATNRRRDNFRDIVTPRFDRAFVVGSLLTGLKQFRCRKDVFA